MIAGEQACEFLTDAAGRTGNESGLPRGRIGSHHTLRIGDAGLDYPAEMAVPMLGRATVQERFHRLLTVSSLVPSTTPAKLAVARDTDGLGTGLLFEHASR